MAHVNSKTTKLTSKTLNPAPPSPELLLSGKHISHRMGGRGFGMSLLWLMVLNTIYVIDLCCLKHHPFGVVPLVHYFLVYIIQIRGYDSRFRVYG